jgi:hypothetical protein
MKKENSKILAVALAALSLVGGVPPTTNANEAPTNVRATETQNTKPQQQAPTQSNIGVREVIPSYGLGGYKSHKDYNGGHLSRYKQQQKFKKYCKSKK